MNKFFKKLFFRPKWQLLSFVLVLILLLIGFKACRGKNPMLAKSYSILRSNNWAPLELFGKEPNMGAFIDELVVEISQKKELKMTLSVVNNLDSHGLVQILDARRYDAIITALSPSSYLKNKYYISDPIFKAGPVLIVKKDSHAKSLADLEGRAIGIKKGSTAAFQLGHESSLFISYDNIEAALDDLEKNILAGVVMEAELAQIYVHGFYKDALKIATAPLTDLGIRLIALQTPANEFLIQEFNAGLAEVEEDGSFEKLIHKWELTNL
jgi:ABC-type amino acid transport substrate-binding protein